MIFIIKLDNILKCYLTIIVIYITGHIFIIKDIHVLYNVLTLSNIYYITLYMHHIWYNILYNI